ncbi:hypothetical protein [Helicobacter sp. MIT 14-3879]|nr:hypothetical protein [Helicobacter sp. MIT 14-3879]
MPNTKIKTEEFLIHLKAEASYKKQGLSGKISQNLQLSQAKMARVKRHF